ncbi:gluconokinase [Falsirhodobacter halotolerans]|uniref:gluconokinase n=1 Tax=Falsirhodobacter halotolerans TaxID=1146892 RepID=UPI001FD26C5A|nr:gluconokinase [Falsirhodobacter halotolerans]MCJ8141185.1 gluconokinase [Falsirhodobacter halotolerans]
MASHIIVMGVSGCGKSHIGKELAAQLGRPFIEGDAFHSAHSRRKMRDGIPLEDDDRWDWLRRVAFRMTAEGRPTVAACSALKRSYRDLLRQSVDGRLVFLHLHAPQDVLLSRIKDRSGHFMPSSLLQSQFDTLEPLGADENGVMVDVTPPIAVVVQDALMAIWRGMDSVEHASNGRGGKKDRFSNGV